MGVKMPKQIYKRRLGLHETVHIFDKDMYAVFTFHISKGTLQQ